MWGEEWSVVQLLIGQVSKELKNIKYHLINNCIFSISGTGNIYCFGDGKYGQLGVNIRPETPFLSTPCNVPIPSKVIQVDCGIAHTAAVTGE